MSPSGLANGQAEQSMSNQLPDTRDYGGHSHALHVQPKTYPYERRGIVQLGDPVFDDFCFWEMLGHALSIAETINSLLSKTAVDLASVEDLKARLPKLTHAHKQTLEYNEIMMALATGTVRPRNKME